MSTSETLGERRIIELILEQLEKMPSMPIPFGDDVSAYPVNKSQLLVLKTDMLVGKTDVPPGMSLWQAARKAVVMNISDFAAKGVKPSVMMVSLGLTGKTSTKDIKEIGRGLNSGAREYDAYIIGGDTGEASDLIISVSLFGMAKKDRIMLRSEARPGDLVAVTGYFGKPAAGLRIMLEGLKVKQEIRKPLIESVLMPSARLKEGLALSRTKVVTAAIDSSDGLAWSLHEIGKASNVGFWIDKLPIAKEVGKFAEIYRLDPLELTLYGGEEYELVLTLRPQLWKKAEKFVEKAGGKLLQVGKVTKDKGVLLEIDGRRHIIEKRGYEHFKSVNA